MRIYRLVIFSFFVCRLFRFGLSGWQTWSQSKWQMKTKSKPSECLELATNAPHTRMRANKAKVRPSVSKSKTGKNQRAVSCTKIHVLSKVPRPFDDLITSSNRFFFLPIFSLWLRAFPFSAVYFDSECYKIVLFGPLIKPLLL